MSLRHGTGGNHRQRPDLKTKGAPRLITDLCVLEPGTETHGMTVVSIHPGVRRERLQASCGWPLKYAAQVGETPPPTAEELRELQERTRKAHGG